MNHDLITTKPWKSIKNAVQFHAHDVGGGLVVAMAAAGMSSIVVMVAEGVSFFVVVVALEVGTKSKASSQRLSQLFVFILLISDQRSRPR